MQENQNNLDQFDNMASQISDLVAETSETNDRLVELQDYFITKDKQAEKEKAELEKAEQEQAELDKQEQEKQASTEAEKTASEDAQAETYTELLTDIKTGIELQNQLDAGIIFFMGVIFGLLFINIIWNRFTK